MKKPIGLIVSLLLFSVTTAVFSQNANTSTTKPARPRTKTSTSQSTPPMQKETPTTPKPATVKTPVTSQVPGSTAVVAAFNRLIDGIQKANVNEVSSVYWNSPHLILFNNNGTVTKGWEQMRKNRESSYPELKDVKLDIRDLSVTMVGRDGAVVTCLWTQSQIFKGTPETASGRMTLVFKRTGTDWKAIHLHTSPDAPNPSSVLPSEQTPTPRPSPTP
ncbi:MAG: AtzH-like domain-containing protein [Pyrinomonadaceae bacterium]